MTFATRFLPYTLLALIVLQGQLLAVRAGDDGGPDSYGGNGDNGGAQAPGSWKPHPNPPTPGGPPGPPGPNPPGPSGPPAPRPDHHDNQCQVLWGQCGGYYYSGTKNCPPGSYCRWFSDWYSQCNPNNN